MLIDSFEAQFILADNGSGGGGGGSGGNNGGEEDTADDEITESDGDPKSE